MITDINKLKGQILDLKYNRIQQGLGLGVAEIDEHIRWKRGSFDVVVGHANTGKTTVILYLMTAFSMKHDLKWLIFSSENTAYSVARKILEFYTGKPITKLSDEEIGEALNWVERHFKIIDVETLYTARTLLEEAKGIKAAWDYDGMLIDPYNSLIKDNTLLRSVGGHEYDYQIASEIRLFCKQQDVSVWLNAHAVTEALRRVHPREHDYAGHPTPPSMADVEGGGKWGNRADQVYAIHRYTMHETDWMISHVHVRKVKETETGGRPTSIDSPVPLRMNNGAAGFSFAGADILHEKYDNFKNLF
jgi:hypothetical protein